MNTKSILVIFAILFAISLTVINTSEVASSIKTNNKNKNLAKSLMKNKSQSKLSLKKKTYSYANPPGAQAGGDLNPKVTAPAAGAKPATTTTAKPAAAKVIQIGATKGKGDIALNDWLQISSKGFSSHYGEIDMGIHGDNINIKTDSFDFRINDAFGKDTNTDNQPATDKVFWFRLSKDLVFYSNTKHDLNLLGGMKINEIIETEAEKRGPNGEHCFVIIDSSSHDWEVCSQHEKVRNQWFCKIQELRNDAKPAYCTESGYDNTKIIVKNVVQPYIIIPIPSRHCNEEWNYQKHGDDWECDCSEGREQSPIDLPAKDKAIDSASIPIFKFSKTQPSNIKSTNDGAKRETENLKIKLEENNLRIKHDRFGKTVTPDGAVYYAEEIVIHTPAEHMINGKTYDMEVQVIHKGKSVGDIGKQLVLSFVFEKQAGVYNKFLEDLDFFNLPNPTSPVVDIIHELYIPKILHNAEDKEEINGMNNFSFYTYQGSLTAPPCSEDTIMYVNSKPLSIGTTALHLFQEALRVPDMIDDKGNVQVSDWIPVSNRNIQPLNGRPVFHYDHEKYCGPDKPRQRAEKMGHFEKIKAVTEKYFYVPGKKVSGIPNAFLVSKDEALNIQADK